MKVLCVTSTTGQPIEEELEVRFDTSILEDKGRRFIKINRKRGGYPFYYLRYGAGRGAVAEPITPKKKEQPKYINLEVENNKTTSSKRCIYCGHHMEEGTIGINVGEIFLGALYALPAFFGIGGMMNACSPIEEGWKCHNCGAKYLDYKKFNQERVTGWVNPQGEKE